jgi:hypothetical protein
MTDWLQYKDLGLRIAIECITKYNSINLKEEEQWEDPRKDGYNKWHE